MGYYEEQDKDSVRVSQIAKRSGCCQGHSFLPECVRAGIRLWIRSWDAMIAELEANGLQETNQMMTDFLAAKVSQ